MTAEDLRVSVALVTRNRPDSLARTLLSLRSQAVQPWEVVVSDDSDDEAAEVVSELVTRFDARYVRGPQRGLYANRNHAALACSGTHVRTMDDDHEFHAGHFARCLAAVASDPRSVWIVGDALPGWTPDFRPPCPGQLHPRGFSVIPPDPQDCWAIADGASFYPRELFNRGVRYAEAFRFGAAYLELGSLLHALGVRIRFIADTSVVHHFDAATRSFLDRDMDLSSQLFAGLCHSFLYQPTLANRALTVGEIVRRTVLRGERGRRVRRAAIAAFRERRTYYRSLAR